ncbi:uncharacterized protein [Fopius arisanus]|uniref:Dxr_0 protein n=1 Tax=Fopius arisanus TaxID=64838 RepID=A0A0C9QIU4_9HYME|nr:PREDICTED: uncharacterized protein LOC105270472 [Fopius arisanus]
MISAAGQFIFCTGFLLLLAINSGEALECYECVSHALADDRCKGDFITQKGDKDVVNCSQSVLNKWHNKMIHNTELYGLASVFEVAPSTYPSPDLEQFSCLKLELKVNNEVKTMRTCQSKKTAVLDPCKKVEQVAMNIPEKAISVEFCGLCSKDKCNGTGTTSSTYLATFLSLVVTLSLMSYLHRAV